MNWLLDSNILIDYLNGVRHAAETVTRREATSISRISWMEVLVGAADGGEHQALRAWLSRFAIVEIDAAVAERAVELRQTRGLRLPDALIWASAQVHALILVTRNTRDFPAGEPGIHVPYGLGEAGA